MVKDLPPLAKSTFKRPKPDESRLIAYTLLNQVNRQGAYANIRLPELLSQSSCDDRDKAFATELSYGTLRMQGKHDFAISTKIDRPFEEVDPAVIDLLRLGLHQIFEMRVPDHAAVDATVELARAVAGEGKASYVNAILRAILREPPDFSTSDLSVRYSHPTWIISALEARLGSTDRLEPLLTAHNTPVAPHLVAWPGKSTTDELIAQGGEAISESRFAVRSSKMPSNYAAVHERRAGVQDLGSQIITEIFFNTAHQHEYLGWLDMCAGPGGKAALLNNLLRVSRPKDNFTANEPTPHRAELVSRVVPSAQVISHRGEDLPELPARYDRILIDAPCSGLGALRRRPESRWNKSVRDLKGLVSLQRELLDAGSKILNPSGVIAYVTCSPHRSETISQVVDFLHSHKDFILISAEPYIPKSAYDMGFLEEGGTIQMWSDIHGTDSMFMALFSKIATVS
jgi:16S rRNA (cytosine967-C5)-methyltransferase